MVDMGYFIVLLAVICFLCVFIGWTIGYGDAQKKYRERGRRSERI